MNFIQKDHIKYEGSLECDIPMRIISAKMLESREVICQIEWKHRYDGSKPINSNISNTELKLAYPMLLIEYYESKLKINK